MNQQQLRNFAFHVQTLSTMQEGECHLFGCAGSMVRVRRHADGWFAMTDVVAEESRTLPNLGAAVNAYANIVHKYAAEVGAAV